ncbi:hypothetical protein [Streptomyces sp. NBC_00334]|uniref:hypothetical protein n=1 Tax=Streptomyces sp. NBC_00334 TaxID=2975713 RepID=UPI002E285BE9|nr:hypothetical protein [Streptomyces sp. NBC_00334]
MQQHAENGGDHTTDAEEEPEPYDDEVYDDEAEDDESAYQDAVVPGGDATAARSSQERGPDVFLDVPQLKVDELNLDVENLRAHVSLQAEVLDLLKLNVGADVALGQVHLGISGVEAQARLEVRLDNVALIINRVLTTLDRNPRILEDLARGVGSAVQDVGQGAGSAVQDVGQGAGSAVQDVGQGAGSAVQDVGQGAGAAVQDVGRGAGSAVEDVGGSAGEAVGEVGRGVGRGAGDALGEVGGAAGEAAADVDDVARGTVRSAERGVGRTAEEAGPGEEATGRITRGAAGTAESTTRPGHGTDRAGPSRRTGARQTPGRTGDDAASRRSAVRRRRTRDDDESEAVRPARRGMVRKRDEPP